MQNFEYRVGNARVTRVSELTINNTPEYLYPKWDPSILRTYGDRLVPEALAPGRQNLMQSIHSWVVRTGEHTILIDTATGNDKPRPLLPALDHLNEPYLARLRSAGVRPEEVDFVLLTHLHVDHVGWNTRLLHGQWTPTFPNARYVMPGAEYEFYLANKHDPRRIIFEDSVVPVVQAGLADFVGEAGGEIIPGFTYLPTPGHSIGHMSIALESAGEHALFGGDVLHHPIQVYRPDLNSVYCEDPALAATSRMKAIEHVVGNDAIYFSTHFPGSSAGRISRSAEVFEWSFA